MRQSLVLVCGLREATGSIVVDPGALDPNAVIIDFESYATGTRLPIYDGFVLITASDDSQSWSVMESPADYVQIPGVVEGRLLGHSTSDNFIDFDRPVSQFGMGIHDPNFPGNILRALDAEGNILEEVISGSPEFPFGQMGNGFATYVGFVRPTNDISRIELIHAYNDEYSIGDSLGLDNITYYAVPEASSIAVWSGLTACAFGYRRWRKRRPV